MINLKVNVVKNDDLLMIIVIEKCVTLSRLIGEL